VERTTPGEEEAGGRRQETGDRRQEEAGNRTDDGPTTPQAKGSCAWLGLRIGFELELGLTSQSRLRD